MEEVYSFDKLDVAKAIYNTTDINHPGVSKTIGMGNRLIGGTIELLARIPRSSLRNHRMNPLETEIGNSKEKLGECGRIPNTECSSYCT